MSPTLEFDEAIRLNPQDAGAYYSRGYDGPGGWLPADDVEIVENEKTAGFPRTLTGVEVHVRYREFDRPEMT